MIRVSSDVWGITQGLCPLFEPSLTPLEGRREESVGAVALWPEP